MMSDDHLMLVASIVCNGEYTQDADELMFTQPLTTRLKLADLFNNVLLDLDALCKLQSIGIKLDDIAKRRDLFESSVIRQDRLLAVEGIKTPTLMDLDAGIMVPPLVLPPTMKAPSAPVKRATAGPKTFAHTNFVRKKDADYAEQKKLAGYILREFY